MCLLTRLWYWRYPKVAELTAKRYLSYNEELAYIERLRKSGKVFVIRPRKPSGVSRVEKDAEKLKKLYRQGYRDAKVSYRELKAFLEKQEK